MSDQHTVGEPMAEIQVVVRLLDHGQIMEVEKWAPVADVDDPDSLAMAIDHAVSVAARGVMSRRHPGWWIVDQSFDAETGNCVTTFRDGSQSFTAGA